MTATAQQPQLTPVAEEALGAFAGRLMVAHPSQIGNIVSLGNALKGNALDPQTRAALINEVNKDPAAAIRKAEAAISQNPATVLAQMKANPAMIAQVMGVQTSPSSQTAPQAPTQTATAPPRADTPRRDDSLGGPRPALPDAPQTATTPPSPVATVVAGSAPPAPAASSAPPRPDRAPEKPPVTQAAASITAAEQESNRILEKVAKMNGFQDFAARAATNPHLSSVLQSALGSGSSPEQRLARLKKIEPMLDKNPNYFVQMNKFMKEYPGLSSSMLSMAAENPEAAPTVMAMAPAAGTMMNLVGGIFGVSAGAKIASWLGDFLKSGFGQLMIGLMTGSLDMFARSTGKVFGSSNNGYGLGDTARQLTQTLHGVSPTITPREALPDAAPGTAPGARLDNRPQLPGQSGAS